MGYFDPWICEDCGLELHWSAGTDYMVHDALWLTVMPSEKGHLCPLCLETRLGRPLKTCDFTRVPINEDIYGRLRWLRQQGPEALLAEAHRRRARLDRRAAQARERRRLTKSR